MDVFITQARLDVIPWLALIIGCLYLMYPILMLLFVNPVFLRIQQDRLSYFIIRHSL